MHMDFCGSAALQLFSDRIMSVYTTFEGELCSFK